MSGNEKQRAGGKQYYITVALDDPHGPPHLGHSLEKVAADVIARYHRLRGHDTHFCMGLDEDSHHMMHAANVSNTDAITWIERMEEAFKLAWSKLEVSYDYWVRTTEEHHFRASQKIFRRAQERGDIYKSTYSGWYCTNCIAFYADDELVQGRCPHHPSFLPEWTEEESYFFALSKYSDRLLEYIKEHPDFIVPAVWQSEVLATIRRGLRDFSVSRPVGPETGSRGIPVPGDPQHVTYVWFDALTNYLAAVGFPDDMAKFEHYWPANAHVIGKNIMRFHCLYWPAMLMSAGLPLPGQVAVHGFITLEGRPVSETTHNPIDPVQLVDEFGADAVRYYLMRDVSLAADGDFSRARLTQRYNDELANDLGKLLNRVVTMIGRYRNGAVPAPGAAGRPEEDLRRLAGETHQRAAAALDAWDIDGALGIAWSFLRRTNQYLEQSEPWRLAHQPEKEEQLDTVLYSAAEAMRLLAIFLAPYIPSTCDRIMSQLGQETVGEGDWVRMGRWGSSLLISVTPGPLLFPRIATVQVTSGEHNAG